MLIKRIIYLALCSGLTISTPLKASHFVQPTANAKIDLRRDSTHAIKGTNVPILVRDTDIRNEKRISGSAPNPSTDVLILHSPTTPALQPRQAFDLTVIDRQMVLRSIAFAAVSNAGRLLLQNLFKAHQILTSSWSRQPPLKSFDITFGSLRLAFRSPTDAIPWDFCAEVLRQFTEEVKRGFANFRFVVYDTVAFGTMYFAFTLVGLAGHDMWYYGGGAGIPLPPNSFNMHG